MNYTEFTEAVCDRVRELYSDGDCVVELWPGVKNNSVKLMGITVRRNGETATPIIYLEDYYAMYCDGMEIEDIVKNILEEDENARNGFNIDLPDFMDYDALKDNIVCRVINTRCNEKILKEAPHVDFLDLSIVYYSIIGAPGRTQASFMILNKHLEIWGENADALHTLALKNTFHLNPVCVVEMNRLLAEMAVNLSVEDREEMAEFIRGQDAMSMYVLTNPSRLFGAVGILRKDVMRNFGKEHGDFYILPSSVHELILVPLCECDEDAAENLCRIVHEVNFTQVPADEILAEGIYHYDCVADEISKLNLIKP